MKYCLIMKLFLIVIIGSFSLTACSNKLDTSFQNAALEDAMKKIDKEVDGDLIIPPHFQKEQLQTKPSRTPQK